ncbi:DUF305 domain-containing protein [Sinomonas mesophila]|uniref:DUF305 domain-containing protein n=1 Tax=Sinomonas mesophila TaxID=1531955 RepID=UPI000986230C|nr:DUF305 domain-containing protein [Sinomonas mesophila]
MNLKSNTLRFALPATALAAALALAGCGAPGPSTAPTSSAAPSSTGGAHGNHEMPMGTPNAGFNAGDVMFAQMMVPHHEQAVEMSDIVLAKPGLDPRVAQLAEQIKGAQAPEIATLRGWLGEWGQPSMMPGGAGHGMDGMMSADDLEKLRAAGAAEAAKLFLTQMIAHHEGAVSMAQTEKSSGQHAGAKSMAESIIASQTKEIEDMKALLAS